MRKNCGTWLKVSVKPSTTRVSREKVEIQGKPERKATKCDSPHEGFVFCSNVDPLISVAEGEEEEFAAKLVARDARVKYLDIFPFNASLFPPKKASKKRLRSATCEREEKLHISETPDAHQCHCVWACTDTHSVATFSLLRKNFISLPLAQIAFLQTCFQSLVPWSERKTQLCVS